MKIIAVIPARYQSTRFPGKPLANICGKPMIWWVYEQCKKVKDFSDVIVATDDERIEKTCKEYKMNVLMTSNKHQTGTDRVGEVATIVDADLYVNIQGDEPVIDPRMIQDVINIFKDNENAYFGSLREHITDEEEINANSTVKVVVDKNDRALYFSRNVIPSNSKGYNLARIYRHIGIFAYKKQFLFNYCKLRQSELELGEGIEPLRAVENGYEMIVRETKFKSVGVDYPEHIKLVEEFIKRNNLL